MAGKSLVHGIDGRQFAPDRMTTRAEFTVLIARALDLADPPSSVQFSDVPGTKWFTKAIGAAGEAGLITGYPNGTFQPDALITREQMAVLIVRAAAFAGRKPAAAKNALDQFIDSSSVSPWAADSVNEAVAAGFVQGLNQDRIAAKDAGMRAQAAVMIKRLLVYVNLID
ncbi:Endo-1,4-beta-xylanase A precursor [compost metagenome]